MLRGFVDKCKVSVCHLICSQGLDVDHRHLAEHFLRLRSIQLVRPYIPPRPLHTQAIDVGTVTRRTFDLLHRHLLGHLGPGHEFVEFPLILLRSDLTDGLEEGWLDRND